MNPARAQSRLTPRPVEQLLVEALRLCTAAHEGEDGCEIAQVVADVRILEPFHDLQPLPHGSTKMAGPDDGVAME